MECHIWGDAVDPISVGLLAALAGGAGGEMGREAWAGLVALVRRPFRRRDDAVPVQASGDAELVALAQAPADPARARALSEVLARRAAGDEDFARALDLWRRQAPAVGEAGSVTNTVSGGTQHGPVLQGRDFSGITFTTSPPPPSAPGHQPGPGAGTTGPSASGQ